MSEEQVRDVLAQMVRVGFVSARQPEKMRVRVELRDTTGAALITDWLPVLCPRAHGDAQYDLPDVDDQVLCLFLPFGLEQGFVLGAMYGKASPPVSSGDKWHRSFSDGTVLEYDRKAHKLAAVVKGDVELVADGSVAATVTGAMQADVQGALHANSAESLNFTAPAMNLGGTGSAGTAATMSGTFSLRDGDIIVEGISFLRHVHPCPHGGTTGVPQ